MELEEEDARAELTVFQTKESYVYQIPPAATAGHRAETWNVDDWLQVLNAPVKLAGTFLTTGSSEPDNTVLSGACLHLCYGLEICNTAVTP